MANIEWQTFFEATAAVFVTAFSVMFVSLQVQYRVWSSSPLRYAAALSALTELFVPIVISLVALMAAMPWRVGVIAGGVIGMAALAYHVRTWRIYKKQSDRFDRKQIRLMALSWVVYGCLFLGGVLPTWQFIPYVLGALMVWLLISGSFEAWYLLDADRSHRTRHGGR